MEDPHDFIETAVELRAVRWETQGMGRRQFVQVVVGSKRCAEVPVERVPYVNRVVATTAGNAEGKREKRIHVLLQNLKNTWEPIYYGIAETSVSLASLQASNTKDPLTIDPTFCLYSG